MDRISIGRMLAVAGMAGALSACATSEPGREAFVVGESACQPLRFDVYFSQGQARLTDAATMAISAAATQVQNCNIRHVKVLGLADATGTPEANQTLSQRRARETARALMAAGLPTPAFEVAAAGAAGAVADDGTDEPLRRRAAVLIEAAPR